MSLAWLQAIMAGDDRARGTDRGCGCAQTQGGGNCANALTAAARLGLAPMLVTKLGGDAVGDGIVEELAADGVDTGLALRQPGAPSPFTYIIVDAEGVPELWPLSASQRLPATPPSTLQCPPASMRNQSTVLSRR